MFNCLNYDPKDSHSIWLGSNLVNRKLFDAQQLWESTTWALSRMENPLYTSLYILLHMTLVSINIASPSLSVPLTQGTAGEGRSKHTHKQKNTQEKGKTSTAEGKHS